MSQCRSISSIILILLLSGCALPWAKRLDAVYADPQMQPTTSPAASEKQSRPIAPLEPKKPAEPQLIIRPQANLSIFHLSIPAGSVSRSSEFWKRIDEQSI